MAKTPAYGTPEYYALIAKKNPWLKEQPTKIGDISVGTKKQIGGKVMRMTAKGYWEPTGEVELPAEPKKITPAMLGTPITGYPKTQAQMTQWQQKYIFDPATKKWYEKMSIQRAKAAEIGAYKPLVESGKDLQTWYGVTEGAPKSETEIKARYRELGGTERWTGSETQYKWMLQQEKKQAELPPPAPPVEPEKPEEPEEEPEGAGVPEPTDEGTTTGGQINVTDTNVQMDTAATTDVVENAMTDIQQTIGSTDIGDIMAEISTTEEWSPELEIAEEEKEAALEQLKTSSANALQTMQQNLAKRGMTFSGIRTKMEADLAAETLAKESGITREFARRIITAARNEQNRRETALKTAQTNYNNALKAAGYVYNPYTDKIETTMEHQRLELARQGMQISAARAQISAMRLQQPQRFTSQGNIFEFDPVTGNLSMLYQAPPTERNLNIRYFTDEKGNVVKVVADPLTGAELYRENVGQIGRSTPDVMEELCLLDPTMPGCTDYLEGKGTYIGSEGAQSEEDKNWLDSVGEWIGGGWEWVKGLGEEILE